MTADIDTELDAPAELSLGEALGLALRLHREKAYEGAEALYRRIIEAAPELADAHHFLGVLCHESGRSAEGIALIQRAIELVPDFPGFHNNLGNIHMQCGQLAEATACYGRAIQLAPDDADLHNNHGALLKAEKRFEEAAASFQRAMGLDPGNVRAYNNMGLLHAAQGQTAEAIRYYCESIGRIPGHPEAHKLLGLTYYSLGRHEEAAEVFRQWVEVAPEHPVARHMYAACSGQGVPERAADDYVEYTFDRFASSFEEQLNLKLSYQAPQLCASALTRQAGARRGLDLLDAGCGTGLCGPLVAPLCDRLVGVDLSGGMLELAATKGVYTELAKAELTEFLLGQGEVWDVIMSADTLCYFGDLRRVVAAAAGGLKADGLLVFTVEQVDDGTPPEGFRINPHGRYSHTRGHVEEVVRAAGLALLEAGEDSLRTEGGKPVQGLVVVARKP
ncbi:MAG: tetratricopeptide repeat protein [Zoogloea sp.]|uniref:tetratricopeptide repeat protein n=1 Tax=Zoogloea sp. TaxID=49181 RepID=UPI00261727EB|nr:tetratricopeptide repeat protein [Zoogloea sp.]MDD2988633.1 tetratricopeptide repeat protein [Zoogloea sp.]